MTQDTPRVASTRLPALDRELPDAAPDGTDGLGVLCAMQDGATDPDAVAAATGIGRERSAAALRSLESSRHVQRLQHPSGEESLWLLTKAGMCCVLASEVRVPA